MLSMATVVGRSACGGSGSLGGYSGVSKSVLTSVDLPRPDSPAEDKHQTVLVSQQAHDVPTTMAVNWKPLRTLLRWTWLGRFAKPT